MMVKTDFKTRFNFAVGLRFELFYALQVLTDEKARVHARWKERSLRALPSEFDKLFKTIGGSSVMWSVVADSLRTKPITMSFKEIQGEMRALELANFQREVLCGALHYDSLAEKLLKREISLVQALGKIPKPKQEWLTFIDLYPCQAGEPMIRAMELLIHKPDKFRDAVIKILEIFWHGVFKNTWLQLQPQLKRSLEEKERLFQSCSLDEFSKQALLRIEVDEHKELIKAVRGGYQLSFKNLKEGFIVPSLFNDKRYWTAFEDGGETTVYFPYFDPSITLDLDPANEQQGPIDPELDPALIFKALGDTTRYAIAKMIASNPISSVKIAKTLSVSKPTISHHVHILREAGLLNETYSNGSVLLSMKKEVLEYLSILVVEKLFGQEKTLGNRNLRRSKV